MRISDWSSDVCSSDLVFIIVPEQRQTGAHPATEPGTFVADLVGGHLLRIELQEILDLGRIAGAIAIGIGRRGCRAARIEAATLETLREAEINHLVDRRLPRHSSLRGAIAKGFTAGEVGGRTPELSFRPPKKTEQ